MLSLSMEYALGSLDQMEVGRHELLSFKASGPTLAPLNLVLSCPPGPMASSL